MSTAGRCKEREFEGKHSRSGVGEDSVCKQRPRRLALREGAHFWTSREAFSSFAEGHRRPTRVGILFVRRCRSLSGARAESMIEEGRRGRG